MGGRAEPQLQGQQVEAGNSTSDNLQSANTYCSDPLDVQGPHAASCQWMKTAGDDCTQSDDNACRCRDYNSVKQKCTGCSVNPCQKRFCFDIIDLPDNNCQWMYNGSGTNQRQCWLKPTLVSTDCNSWGDSAAGRTPTTAPH